MQELEQLGMKIFTTMLFLSVFCFAVSPTMAEQKPETIGHEVMITGRDPFWPVGYTPPPPEEEITHIPDTTTVPDDTPVVIDKDEIEWPRLRVRGITSTLDGGYIAMIDGFGIAEPGQIIQITERRTLFRWEVVEITKRGMNTRRIDARPVE